jgi:hypothetical protein
MRQDHGDLLGSSQPTQEVAIEALQQVPKAIDGGLPAYVDQGHSGSARSAAVLPGIAITRFIVRGLMGVHWVYAPRSADFFRSSVTQLSFTCILPEICAAT